MHPIIHREIARARLEDSLRETLRPHPAGRSQVRPRRRMRAAFAVRSRVIPRHV